MLHREYICFASSDFGFACLRVVFAVLNHDATAHVHVQDLVLAVILHWVALSNERIAFSVSALFCRTFYGWMQGENVPATGSLLDVVTVGGETSFTAA